MDTNTSRRGLLGALAVAPVAALPFVAQAAASDAAIVAAWDYFHRHIEAEDPRTIAEMVKAEDIIVDTPSVSWAGVEAKLRLVADFRIHEDWVTREVLKPVGTPIRGDRAILDYSERVLFGALQDVQRLSGEAR